MGEPSDWKSQTTNSITTDREKNNYSLKNCLQPPLQL